MCRSWGFGGDCAVGLEETGKRQQRPSFAPQAHDGRAPRPDQTAEHRIPELRGDQYYIAQRGGGGWSAPLLSPAGREGAPTHHRRAEPSNRRTTRRRGWSACATARGRGAEPTEPSEARMIEGGEGARQGAGQEPRAPRRGAHYPMQTRCRHNRRAVWRAAWCVSACVRVVSVVLFASVEAGAVLVVVVVSVAVDFWHAVAVA